MSAPAQILRTGNLELVAATLELLEAEIEGPQHLGRLLKATVPASWPPGEYDRAALSYFRERHRADGTAAEGWYVWYALLTSAPEGAVVVGTAGYFGPPDPEGMVEIGYSVLPEFRGRGFGCEMARALVDRVRGDSRILRVIAHVHRENVPSIAILRSCGLHEVGPGQAPETLRFQKSFSLPAAVMSGVSDAAAGTGLSSAPIVEIRPETPADFQQVLEINQAAFGRPLEGNLVAALRGRSDCISMVAAEGAAVLGHIFYSPVRCVPAATGILGLGPMAVRPDRQRRGIGSLLIRSSLARCRALGHGAVVVLGHPDYYPRLGFRPAHLWKLRYEEQVPAEVFMVLELQPGALRDVSGVIHYLPEFAACG
jgi:predicted N-acetyltransferase YhbS/RimJ/RimL family protein N-acetyltransferase